MKPKQSIVILQNCMNKELIMNSNTQPRIKTITEQLLSH